MCNALFLDQGVVGPGHQRRLRLGRGRDSSKQCAHCRLPLLGAWGDTGRWKQTGIDRRGAVETLPKGTAGNAGDADAGVMIDV
jgi:hypothetical protein